LENNNHSNLSVDLLIIGGGINGTGIAVDAAGRGLSVLLTEQSDLANATSSHSSKLIHGGLRYLENYEFRLVREALTEREILMNKAPHLIHTLPFIMPYSGDRSWWRIRLGLFIYDHLRSQGNIPHSKSVSFSNQSSTNPLKATFKKGFIYYDCQTDDARLVITNAIAAKEKGAQIFTRSQLIKTTRSKSAWHAELRHTKNQSITHVTAKVLINATGPWVDEVLRELLHVKSNEQLRLVKGSHIIVKKLYEERNAYLLQTTDGRVVFITPFQDQYSLIGTTDIPYQGDPNTVSPSIEEQHYLCATVNRYLSKEISPGDIVWSYAGVRPLRDDRSANPSKVSRDYELDINIDNEQAPLLSIFGGKITTYRKLAENAVNRLKKYFPAMSEQWTAHSALPGGDIPNNNFDSFVDEVINKYSWLDKSIIRRYANQYGTRLHLILKDCQSESDLGISFGAGLFEREIKYLLSHEWAHTSEDILWRRTKLGLQLNKENILSLEQWLNQHEDLINNV
jgi:glycerol-3-phosphate dehydrogenase